MNSRQRRNNLWYASLGAVLLVLASIGFYLWNAGYTISSGFTLTRGGTIAITIPVPGAQVYLGDQLEESNGSRGVTTIRGLSPSAHQIIVAKEGYWPWTKTLLVSAGATTRASAFLLPREIIPEEIREDDPEFEAIARLLDAAYTSAGSRKTSEDGSVSLWLNGTTLTAQWNTNSANAPEYFCNRGGCTSPIDVFTSNQSVNAFEFYPHRDEVALFAAGNQIFAVEFDKRGTQNFQPLYTGTAPVFTVAKSGEIFIRDTSSIFHISIP